MHKIIFFDSQSNNNNRIKFIADLLISKKRIRSVIKKAGQSISQLAANPNLNHIKEKSNICLLVKIENCLQKRNFSRLYERHKYKIQI